jgi:hypothetical protein
MSNGFTLGHLEKYPFRAACKSDSKNLFMEFARSSNSTSSAAAAWPRARVACSAYSHAEQARKAVSGPRNSGALSRCRQRTIRSASGRGALADD